jgi:hypothetical protein
MIDRLLCMLIGVALAYLAGCLALSLFVYGPVALLEAGASTLPEAGLLALVVARHGAALAAPLALIAAAVGARRRFGGPTYYAACGMAIAGIGFLAESAGRAAGEATMAMAYALTAFLTAGLVAGLVYWLIAGRLAKARAKAGQGDGRRAPVAPRMPEGAA